MQKNNGIVTMKSSIPGYDQANFENVMVDLETLGKRAGCSILSIGAVEFSADGLGREFYVVVGIKGQESLAVDSDTLAWWEKQSDEARTVLEEHKASSLSLGNAIDWLNSFLAPIGRGRLKVWGNGSDFDNAILYAAYAAAGKELPWEFWNSRCFRTLKNMVRNVKPAERSGAHNALADAKWQAEHASRILALARENGVVL